MTDSLFLQKALFSGRTEGWCSPSEPEPGDTLTLTLRTYENSADRVVLDLPGDLPGTVMKKTGRRSPFDYYTAELCLKNKPLFYYFRIECNRQFGGITLYYSALGPSEEAPGESAYFRVIPGFHVPNWTKKAVLYQIFPDRFCNGNLLNDVSNNEYFYTVGHAKHVSDWNAPPSDTDIRAFYGGDLQGIAEKLDDLSSLGITGIYLNPIFVSPSSHKYDVQDYDHIDPHLAVITDDLEHEMQSWEKHNGYAPKYIRRVTSRENLEASDACFAHLCKELHARGMKIILDGVFNHCGSFHKWLDREGIYRGKPGFLPGAYENPESPYREFFKFNESRKGSAAPEYEGWWGYSTLPKLNYEQSEALEREILRIAEKWASPPYSIDGWRLDVAADLGHSEDFNHRFWKKFRAVLKKQNPDLLILAEHYGSPSDWLLGDEWDSVMNYDAFMEPISHFLTGMEKHSDYRRDDLYRDGKAFFSTMLQKMAALPIQSLSVAMNELSNHDHSRFLTRTNRKAGRASDLGPEAAKEGVNPAVFRAAVLLQMTWIGTPTVYYGDEAGQVGFTDPDNRRTYPWGREDRELISLHKALISLRKTHSALVSGATKPLLADHGQIAYARFDENEAAVIAVNNTENALEVSIPVWEIGLPEGTQYLRALETNESGFTVSPSPFIQTAGAISLPLPPFSSALLFSIPNTKSC